MESTSIYTSAVKFVAGAEGVEGGSTDGQGSGDYDDVMPPLDDTTGSSPELDEAGADIGPIEGEWDGTYPDPTPSGETGAESGEDWMLIDDIGRRGVSVGSPVARQGMDAIVDGITANLQG